MNLKIQVFENFEWADVFLNDGDQNIGIIQIASYEDVCDYAKILSANRGDTAFRVVIAETEEPFRDSIFWQGKEWHG